MAKDDKKKEKIAEELHTEEGYTNLYGEWEKYHGRVEHPVTGKEVSKEQLIQEELSDLVEAAQKDLKSKISKRDARDTEKVQKEVWELAKKAYMARHGMKKEPTDEEEKKLFEQNVRDNLVGIASRATGQSIETYEHAMAEIVAATNPIYGKEDERSKILDALLQTYALEIHKGEIEPIKGLRASRLAYLRRELTSRYYSPYWHKKHGTTLRDHGYEADFAKSAASPEIMGTIEGLLNTGEANTKVPYIKAKTHIRKKAEYKKAA